MARITVEDCLENVDNRFQLVLVATKRARQLSRGAEPKVARENDKPTVLALREIADGLVGPEVLDENDGPVSREPEVREPVLDLAAEIAAEFARAEASDDEEPEEDDLDDDEVEVVPLDEVDEMPASEPEKDAPGA